MLSEKTTNISDTIGGATKLGKRPLSDPVTITDTASSAFDSKFSLNPLVAAATPILTAMSKVQLNQTPDPSQLYATTIKEIKIFEEKARKNEYRSAIILAGRYFLCAYIDEMMLQGDKKVKTLWLEHPILQTLQGENFGGERFFMILERASDDPQAHLHLLELGLLCLNLGYQGKYAHVDNSQRELEHIKDNLLTIIDKYREPAQQSLFIGSGIERQEPIRIKKRSKQLPHLLIAGAIAVVGLLGVYLPYQIHLNKKAKPIQSTLTKMSNLANAEINHD